MCSKCLLLEKKAFTVVRFLLMSLKGLRRPRLSYSFLVYGATAVTMHEKQEPITLQNHSLYGGIT